MLGLELYYISERRLGLLHEKKNDAKQQRNWKKVKTAKITEYNLYLDETVLYCNRTKNMEIINQR